MTHLVDGGAGSNRVALAQRDRGAGLQHHHTDRVARDVVQLARKAQPLGACRDLGGCAALFEKTRGG